MTVTERTGIKAERVPEARSCTIWQNVLMDLDFLPHATGASRCHQMVLI